MKNRNQINLIIDTLMLLVFACLAGIGFLIKYVLPPGREQIHSTGSNFELTLCGWDRHQWGHMHAVVAWVLVALLVLHILFHWKTITCLVRQAVPKKPLRSALVAVSLVLTAFLLLFPAFIQPQQSGRNEYLYRHRSQTDKHRDEGLPQRRPAVDHTESRVQPVDRPFADRTTERKGRQAEKKDSLQIEHDHHDEAHLLQGRMTIAQVAQVYEISTAEVKNRLGIPAAVSNGMTLGRLRRQYGFSMTQARDRLQAKGETSPIQTNDRGIR